MSIGFMNAIKAHLAPIKSMTNFNPSAGPNSSPIKERTNPHLLRTTVHTGIKSPGMSGSLGEQAPSQNIVGGGAAGSSGGLVSSQGGLISGLSDLGKI